MCWKWSSSRNNEFLCPFCNCFRIEVEFGRFEFWRERCQKWTGVEHSRKWSKFDRKVPKEFVETFDRRSLRGLSLRGELRDERQDHHSDHRVEDQRSRLPQQHRRRDLRAVLEVLLRDHHVHRRSLGSAGKQWIMLSCLDNVNNGYWWSCQLDITIIWILLQIFYCNHCDKVIEWDAKSWLARDRCGGKSLINNIISSNFFFPDIFTNIILMLWYEKSWLGFLISDRNGYSKCYRKTRSGKLFKLTLKLK